jgi:hypothetical protein
MVCCKWSCLPFHVLPMVFTSNDAHVVFNCVKLTCTHVSRALVLVHTAASIDCTDEFLSFFTDNILVPFIDVLL